MNPTAAEIDAMVNPSLPDLVKETQELSKFGQWEQVAANVKRLMRHKNEPGGYTESQCFHALADCAMNLGLAGQAITHYRDAIRCEPVTPMAHENLIFLLDSQPWTTDAEAQKARDDWWRCIGAPAYALRRPFTNTRDPDKRLRVGYVSSDYRFHSAMIACEPVLMHHTEQIEPVFYSTLPEPFYDHICKQWKEMWGPHFVDVSRFTPSAFAEIVYNDKIDILVDLSGYTAGNRLQGFAFAPAPVRVTAWGYATGVGCPAMTHLFADKIVATPAMRKRLYEQVVDLPCVISFLPRPDLPEPNELPCLNAGPVFGVFQRASKINEHTLSVWKTILQRTPESRILFKGHDYTAHIREWIIAQMRSVQRQVSFEGATSHKDQQLWYTTVDLSLDPWPQTGGVSTMESCFMGVPCVTLIGDRVIQRTSASILTVLGLTDLIAKNEKQYIQIACDLVTTRMDYLADIRRKIRGCMQASPIMSGYRDVVEAAYRQIWQDWCAKEKEQAA